VAQLSALLGGGLPTGAANDEHARRLAALRRTD
jgi:hypothetical protein